MEAVSAAVAPPGLAPGGVRAVGGWFISRSAVEAALDMGMFWWTCLEALVRFRRKKETSAKVLVSTWMVILCAAFVTSRAGHP